MRRDKLFLRDSKNVAPYFSISFSYENNVLFEEGKCSSKSFNSLLFYENFLHANLGHLKVEIL